MRRHLGMSGEQWRALPWHDQRAYREGLRKEFTAEPEIPAADDDELRSLGVIFN